MLEKLESGPETRMLVVLEVLVAEAEEATDVAGSLPESDESSPEGQFESLYIVASPGPY
jgi:hypothetical protein